MAGLLRQTDPFYCLPDVLRRLDPSLLLPSTRENQGERKQRSCRHCCQRLMSHRTTIYPTAFKAGHMALLVVLCNLKSPLL